MRVGVTGSGDPMATEKSGVELTQQEVALVLGALGQGALVHMYPPRSRVSKARLMARRRARTGAPLPPMAETPELPSCDPNPA